MSFHPLLLLGLICICILCMPTSASNISAKVEETWIRWQWLEPSGNTTTDVYIDGKLTSENTHFNYSYLKGLEPLEKHTIQVYNSSNASELLYDSTITTLYPKVNIFIFIGIEIFLTILVLVSKEPFKVILVGVVTIVLALYTSSISYGYEGLYLLPLIVALVVGLFLAIKLWEAARGNVRWY